DASHDGERLTGRRSGRGTTGRLADWMLAREEGRLADRPAGRRPQRDSKPSAGANAVNPLRVNVAIPARMNVVFPACANAVIPAQAGIQSFPQPVGLRPAPGRRVLESAQASRVYKHWLAHSGRQRTAWPRSLPAYEFHF